MLPDTPTFDSRAWTGPQPADWPKRSNWRPPPRRVEIRHSPAKLLRAVLLDLALLGGLALTWPRIVDPTALTILGALGLSVFALALALHHLRLLVSAVASRAPLIVLEAAGLSWPEAFDGVVPWRNIIQVANRPALVGLILVPPPLSGLFLAIPGQPRHVARVNALPPTGGRLGWIRVPTLLDRSRNELYALIQAFRAHLGD